MDDVRKDETLFDDFPWYEHQEGPMVARGEKWVVLQVGAYRSLYSALESCTHGVYGGYRVVSLRATEARYPQNGTLWCIRATKANKTYRAFCCSELACDALVILASKLRNGSLSWQEEKPFEGRDNEDKPKVGLTRPEGL